MSNSFLEKIIRNNEMLKYLDEVNKEIKNASDRGIVLICGSIIDEMLGNLLKGVLIESNKIDKDLFKSNNPLSTFDGKKKMAFYLGLISEQEMKNITYLIRVRNRFAHRIINISFDNEDIKNICLNFAIPKNAYVPDIIPFPDKETGELKKVDLNPIKKETSAKDRFIFTFKYLYRQLGFRMTSDVVIKRSEFSSEELPYDVHDRMIKIIKDALSYEEELLLKTEELLDKSIKLIDQSFELDENMTEKELEELKKERVSYVKELDDLDVKADSYVERKKLLESLIALLEFTNKVIENSMK